MVELNNMIYKLFNYLKNLKSRKQISKVITRVVTKDTITYTIVIKRNTT